MIKERRKLMHLRRLIDEAPPVHREALAWMARMLGPERLGKVNEAVGRMKPANLIDLNTNIRELEISVRLENCVVASGIRTVGELASKTEAELLRTKCFGKKSLKEVKEVLAKMGLSLKGESEAVSRMRAAPTPSLIDLNTSVEELEFSVRTQCVLQNANIRTLGELASKTESELLRTKNCGRKCLKEVKDVLTERGLSFSSEPEAIRRMKAAPTPDLIDLNTNVWELGFSNRAKGCLAGAGIRTLGELTSKTDRELLKIKQFGMESLKEVKQFLDEIGLSLRSESKSVNRIRLAPPGNPMAS